MRFTVITFILALIINSIHAANFKEYVKEIDYGTEIPNAIETRQHEENNGIEIKSQKIIRGYPTDIKHIPYQVGLLINLRSSARRKNREEQSFCGGSLLTSTRILTAAHCYDNADQRFRGFNVSKTTAVLGSNALYTGGVRRTVTSLAIHPSYNIDTVDNDVAVLRIPAVPFSDVIQPIALPSIYIRNLNFSGAKGLISGYGMTSDHDSETNRVLNSVQMNIISNKKCAKAPFGTYVKNSNICVQGQNGASACSGDSGGPLVINRGGRKILVGVSSFGAKFCERGYPVAYARVTSFLPWIMSNINI